MNTQKYWVATRKRPNETWIDNLYSISYVKPTLSLIVDYNDYVEITRQQYRNEYLIPKLKDDKKVADFETNGLELLEDILTVDKASLIPKYGILNTYKYALVLFKNGIGDAEFESLMKNEQPIPLLEVYKNCIAHLRALLHNSRIRSDTLLWKYHSEWWEALVYQCDIDETTTNLRALLHDLETRTANEINALNTQGS